MPPVRFDIKVVPRDRVVENYGFDCSIVVVDEDAMKTFRNWFALPVSSRKRVNVSRRLGSHTACNEYKHREDYDVTWFHRGMSESSKRKQRMCDSDNLSLRGSGVSVVNLEPSLRGRL